MNMERLTRKLPDGRNILTENFAYIRSHKYGSFVEGYAVDKLADYEDAEEQGLLLRLPCKAGDTLFRVFDGRTKCTEHNQEFDDYSCQGCECLECDSQKYKYIKEMKAYSLVWIVVNIGSFGKTVFLTKEEAEQALKRMESE